MSTHIKRRISKTLETHHLDDETLERYVISHCSAELINAVEEHLLFCGRCRLHLDVTEQYCRAMRSALQHISSHCEPLQVRV